MLFSQYAVGAALQVVVEVQASSPAERREASPLAGRIGGFLTGMRVMYLTGLIAG